MCNRDTLIAYWQLILKYVSLVKICGGSTSQSIIIMSLAQIQTKTRKGCVDCGTKEGLEAGRSKQTMANENKETEEGWREREEEGEADETTRRHEEDIVK